MTQKPFLLVKFLLPFAQQIPSHLHSDGIGLVIDQTLSQDDSARQTDDQKDDEQKGEEAKELRVHKHACIKNGCRQL